MFVDGLHHRVSIYPVVYNTSNRGQKDQVANTLEPSQRDVPCRIIKEEKALFQPTILLYSGDVLEDQATGERYEVVRHKTVYGLGEKHHGSYEIKVKPYGKK